jgi:predicted ribosome quality control (RQC) complex YloA/Tae2 family protein
MIAHYYTLRALAHEIHETAAGKTLDEIFTQQRGELVLSFRDFPSAIIVHCEGAHNAFYIRNSYARANKNSVDVLRSAAGTTIRSVAVDESDRQIFFHLSDSQRIVVQMFGPKANVLLVSPENIVVDAFLRKNENVTAAYEPPLHRKISFDPDSFDAALKQCNESTMAQFLKNIFPQFGALLNREVLLRAGLADTARPELLTANERERLLSSARALQKELLAAPAELSPRIYFNGQVPVRMTLIPLQQFAEFRAEIFPSVSQAVQTFLSLSQKSVQNIEEKDSVLHALNKELDQAERTLKKISEEAVPAADADRFERFGKLLTAHLHLIKKGETEALVEDVLSGSGEILSIPLDVHLTPSKNAERFFQKSQKIRRTVEEQSARRQDLQRQRGRLLPLLEALEQASTAEDVQTLLQEHAALLAELGIGFGKQGHAKKQEQIPFRVFTVAGGFKVWAGKSSDNNDLLTTRHTAKNDLWFHARGVGGSHVTLKIGTGKGEVSRQAVEQAAGIAAYYSKMKNSKLVPVTMCEGKYVHKPKGAPSGTVMVEREKTIFAEPALPENGQ